MNNSLLGKYLARKGRMDLSSVRPTPVNRAWEFLKSG